MILQILPIAGVPDELIRVLNDRFRNVSVSSIPGDKAAPTRVSSPAILYPNRVYLRGMTSARPTDLGPNDVGFLFDAIDGYSYRWNGSGWDVVEIYSDQGGIGTASVPVQSIGSGRSYFTIKGISGMGVLELVQTAADADGSGIGLVQFTDASSTNIDKRAVLIVGATMGGTAKNRGGLLKFFTKADGGALALNATLDNLGNFDITGEYRRNGIAIGTGGSVLSAAASADLTLGAAYADITGASVSLNKNGVWIVTGVFDFATGSLDTATEFHGALNYDGSVQTGIAVSTAYGRFTVTQQWKITISGQPKTAKLQALKSGGVGTGTCKATNTTISATFIG